MDESLQEFADLLRAAQANDQQAIRLLHDRYSEGVRRCIRRHLDDRVRRRFDTADFMQSVWLEFFSLSPDRYQFSKPVDLVNFLTTMAVNRVVDKTRQQLDTEKYSLDKERSLEERLPHQAKPIAKVLPDNLASPSQFIIAEERWQSLIEGLPEGHRRVLELLRDGHTYAEISKTLGCHPKVIQRLLRRLEDASEKP